MKVNYKSLLFLLFIFTQGFAQVGVGTTAPQAALDVTATDGGVLVPRVALTAKNVAAPVLNPQGGALVNGTLVWNTATAGLSPNNVIPGFYYWDSTAWVAFGAASTNNWTINGNTGTTAGTNYLGTTDAQDIRFKTQGNDKFNIGNTSGQFSSYSLGSITAPTYTWNADLNTGIYSPSADVMGFTTNGTEKFRIPNANQVHAMSLGTAALPFYSYSADPDTGLYSPTADNLGLSTAGVERVRVEADGDVGIGTTAPNASAKLDINATNRGLLIPNVALTAKNAAGPITTPATSLLVYNTATAGASPNNVVPGYYYWNGAAWVAFTGANSNDWSINGNSGTTTANYVGTSDAMSFKVATNAAERMRFLTNGQVIVNNTGAVPATSQFLSYSAANAVYGESTGGFGGYFTSTTVGGGGAGGVNNTNLGVGTYGSSSGNTGSGVLGNASGTLGAGVYGQSNGIGGAGVWGVSLLTTVDGVYGEAATALDNGVWGTNNNGTGTGVYGTSTGASGYGVYGNTSGTNGISVYGNATGTNATGVWGEANQASRPGVYGRNNNATGIGVYGFTSGLTAAGVYGNSTANTAYGVNGFNSGTSGYGVYGSVTGATAIGVYGRANGTTAFAVDGYNASVNGTGVIGAGNAVPTFYYPTGGGGAGFTGASYGSLSIATNTGNGVGVSGNGNGITTITTVAGGAGGAFSGNQYGLQSYATITGAGNNAIDRAVLYGSYTSAGATVDNVYVGARVGGNFYKILGSGGASVSTTMPTASGERILFAPEAPENWFFDIGEVQLVNGKAEVQLDPIFVDCISDSKPFKVFVQGGENTMGSIRITRNQENKSFIVEDLGGPSNGTVQYNVYAIWKNKAGLRFPEYQRPETIHSLVGKSESRDVTDVKAPEMPESTAKKPVKKDSPQRKVPNVQNDLEVK